MTAACWRAEGVPLGVAVPFVSPGGFVEGRGTIWPSSSNLLISKFNRFKWRSIYRRISTRCFLRDEGPCGYQFLGLVGEDTFLLLDLLHLEKEFFDLLVIFLLKGVCSVSSILSYVPEYLRFSRIFCALCSEELAFPRSQFLVNMLQFRGEVVEAWSRS
jgi:hypothetical protein